MIQIDETDPVGDAEPKFPYRDVTVKRGVDAKELFEMITEIGRGKFGTVFKCKEKTTGMVLAAKFIAVPKKGDRDNVEREVAMMNTLQHPKIIQLYDAYQFGRMMCVIVELVDGGELFDRVLDDKFILTERACAIFMRQICEAMLYIHEKNIIHLDLKPENILCITESGNRIKIIDFGLAREYDPDKRLQVLFGTPEFVAPEVVNFDSISYATDMWSVGVIGYVLVSGLSPFAGETDIETMANVTIGKYDFFDESFDTVSADAVDFITKLLMKDSTLRMTAEEALQHKWLKKKPQFHPTNSITPANNFEFKPITIQPTHELGNKENLKELVDKWSDNSNIPYIFDKSTNNVISPMGNVVNIRRDSLPRRDSLTSSKGCTPSPSGSNNSIPDKIPNEKDDINLVNNNSDHSSAVHSSDNNVESSSPLTTPSPPLSKTPFIDQNVPIIKDSQHKTNVMEDINACDDLTKLSDLLLMTSLKDDCLCSESGKKTEKLENEVNTVKTKKTKTKTEIKPEVAKKPEFLLNNTLKTRTVKFLPKSISLCNEDKIFKENYSKFCDFNSKSVDISEQINNRLNDEDSKRVEITERKEKSKKSSKSSDYFAESISTTKRTKFRVNTMSSRDVPTTINNFSIAKKFIENNMLYTTDVKEDCFLKLMNNANSNTSTEETIDTSLKNHIVSVDFDSETLETRSSKSITTFFQMHAKTGTSVKQMQAQIESKRNF